MQPQATTQVGIKLCARTELNRMDDTDTLAPSSPASSINRRFAGFLKGIFSPRSTDLASPNPSDRDPTDLKPLEPEPRPAKVNAYLS